MGHGSLVGHGSILRWAQTFLKNFRFIEKLFSFVSLQITLHLRVCLVVLIVVTMNNAAIFDRAVIFILIIEMKVFSFAEERFLWN